MRVALFGTYPTQMNGYSKVVYELMQVLAKKDNIQLSIFGFQNFNDNPNHRKNIPDNVYIYDAYENENPKSHGFGIEQVNEFLAAQRPDIAIIYNDVNIIENVLRQIQNIPDRKFKTVLYLDQVYPMQKKQYIEMINKYTDAIIVFTKYWKECIVDQGVTVPTYILEHGFNKLNYFPFPKILARKYFGLKDEDFIVFNLNRNQPRKRWDICIKAWADVVSKLRNEPVKLLIGTDIVGSWNLFEIYERELKKRGMTLEQGMKHVIMLENAQKLSDTDINILYNASDLGITTCDGEGWGLCSFEHAAVGVPQIAPKLGGFLEFFTEDNATLIEPAYNYYLDNARDAVGGEASVCNYVDFSEAIISQYEQFKINPNNRDMSFRKHVINTYNWDVIGNKFMNIIEQILPASESHEINETIQTEPLPDIIEEDEMSIADIVDLDESRLNIAETHIEESMQMQDNEVQDNADKTVNEMNSQFVTKSELNDLNKKIDAILSMMNQPSK